MHTLQFDPASQREATFARRDELKLLGARYEDSNSVAISVRSQGQWATWVLLKTCCDVLLRPGVIAFNGPAKDWIHQAPLLAWEREAVETVGVAGKDQPLLAPIGYGLIVIDYDQRAALGMQTMTNAFSVNLSSWSSETRNTGVSVKAQWLREMLLSGTMRTAEWRENGERTRYSLPTPEAGTRNAAFWLEREALLARYPGSTPINDYSLDTPPVYLPLQAPGWQLWETLEMDSREQGEAALLTQTWNSLLPEEKALWQRWLEDRYEAGAQPLRAFEALSLAETLDNTLAGPSTAARLRL